MAPPGWRHRSTPPRTPRPRRREGGRGRVRSWLRGLLRPLHAANRGSETLHELKGESSASRRAEVRREPIGAFESASCQWGRMFPMPELVPVERSAWESPPTPFEHRVSGDGWPSQTESLFAICHAARQKIISGGGTRGPSPLLGSGLTGRASCSRFRICAGERSVQTGRHSWALRITTCVQVWLGGSLSLVGTQDNR